MITGRGTEERPFNLCKVKPKDFFKELTEIVETEKSGIFFFKTEKGIVKLTKTYNKKTGISTSKYLLNNRQTPISTILAIVTGTETKAEKKMMSDKEIDDVAKAHLLLTSRQLSTVYRFKDLKYALEFNKYGKKEIRKKLFKAHKGERKILGGDVVSALREHFGLEIPTSDIFRIFEFMERYPAATPKRKKTKNKNK